MLGFSMKFHDLRTQRRDYAKHVPFYYTEGVKWSMGSNEKEQKIRATGYSTQKECGGTSGWGIL
jgi:hypothetical protein